MTNIISDEARKYGEGQLKTMRSIIDSPINVRSRLIKVSGWEAELYAAALVAPDLLASLKEALGGLKGAQTTQAGRDRYERAIAAISKAEATS